ncbi:hypothetical protein FFLO_00234 [Filobasidium floriforme]|uniref:Uncharacterized protein n=1 Tax=Filobasidium floriforme TaxID=5210 RepID=A0A8K0JTK7_9TREE|nr:uncharacterized protein HD553DRAFT_368196 [Filobasidium floriforme]KAG7580026.1 hypothetical protein FFLO_00234 [Filobasidium floriforme]KAH8087429.1 hypothetical protein HD553DRAFT_368196 [Filobasidium floriforme]
MSTQVKYEDDDLELYGDIDHEDGTGELLDPDFQKDANDERDEGAVANALGDEDESMTGTGAATSATQAQGQGQGQGQQQQQPAPIPTFQSNNSQFQNQSQNQPQAYQQGQQGAGGGAPYARAYNGDDGRGRGGGSTSDGNEEGPGSCPPCPAVYRDRHRSGVRGRRERGGSPQMIRADAFFLSDGPLYLDWTLSDVDLD